MEMTREQLTVACDILKFIEKHPNAKHTLEGIARYWIFQQRLEEKMDLVVEAIDFLLGEGFLKEVQKGDGDSYYKVNQDRLVDIPPTLEKFNGRSL